MQNDYFARHGLARHWFVMVLLACALLSSRQAAACSTVNTDLLPPYFTYLSLDGRFQFRIIDRMARHPGTRPTGMYRSNDLEHPLWTVDWSDAVQVANDGVHVVRMYAASSIDDPAFALYERDRPLSTFRVKDLVTTNVGLDIPVQPGPLFMNCGGGIVPLRWLKDMEFDDQRGLLVITTVTGDEIDIDLTSGRIVRRSRVAAPTP